jgi:hypothetical protein
VIAGSVAGETAVLTHQPGKVCAGRYGRTKYTFAVDLRSQVRPSELFERIIHDRFPVSDKIGATHELLINEVLKGIVYLVKRQIAIQMPFNCWNARPLLSSGRCRSDSNSLENKCHHPKYGT